MRRLAAVLVVLAMAGCLHAHPSGMPWPRTGLRPIIRTDVLVPMPGADAAVALGGHLTIGAQLFTVFAAVAGHAVLRAYLHDTPGSPYVVASAGFLAIEGGTFGIFGGAIGFEARRVFVELGASAIRRDGEWDHVDLENDFGWPFLDPLILPWAAFGWRLR